MSSNYELLPNYLISVLRKYDIEVYDTAELLSGRVWVLNSNKGKVALQRYDGNSRELWLAYNVFRTLQGNDVLKVVDWFQGVEGAPFIAYGNELFFLTQYYDNVPIENDSLNVQASFLAKWHYLSREIVYARDFADSLATPTSLMQTIRLPHLKGNAAILRDNIVDYMDSNSIGFLTENCLSVNLPGFNDKKLSYKNEQVMFQPIQQVFEWNWQVKDLADFLCNNKTIDTDQVSKLLSEYHHFNPLIAIEWQWLVCLILWALSMSDDYNNNHSIFDKLYKNVLSVAKENGIVIEPPIVVPEPRDILIDKIEEGNCELEQDDNPNSKECSQKLNAETISEVNDAVVIVQSVEDTGYEEKDEIDSNDEICDNQIIPENQTNNDMIEKIDEESIVMDSRVTQEIINDVILDDNNSTEQNLKDVIGNDNALDAEINKTPVSEGKLPSLVWKEFPKSPWENNN